MSVHDMIRQHREAMSRLESGEWTKQDMEWDGIPHLLDCLERAVRALLDSTECTHEQCVPGQQCRVCREMADIDRLAAGGEE